MLSYWIVFMPQLSQAMRLHEFSDASVTVIVLQGRWRSKPGGVNITAKACNLFTFEDGKVRSYTVMNNSAAFAQALTG